MPGEGRVLLLLLGFWTFVVLFPLYWVVDHLVQAADRRQRRPVLPAVRRLPAVARRLALHLRRRCATTRSGPISTRSSSASRSSALALCARLAWPPTRWCGSPTGRGSAPSSCFVLLRRSGRRRRDCLRRALAVVAARRGLALFAPAAADASAAASSARSATTTSRSG